MSSKDSIVVRTGPVPKVPLNKTVWGRTHDDAFVNLNLFQVISVIEFASGKLEAPVTLQILGSNEPPENAVATFTQRIHLSLEDAKRFASLVGAAIANVEARKAETNAA